MPRLHITLCAYTTIPPYFLVSGGQIERRGSIVSYAYVAHYVPTLHYPLTSWCLGGRHKSTWHCTDCQSSLVGSDSVCSLE